jgi:hypothetical protein
MFYLLAQVVPDFSGSSSNGAKATVDAAALARELGPQWFFVVLCFVALVLAGFGIGWVFYKISGKVLDRLDKFLVDIGASTTNNTTILSDHAKVSRAASENIKNLCDAGHNFANAIEKVGKELGVDVSGEIEKIHDKLRTISTT